MKLDINHIANLANLPISKQEEKTLEKELRETLTYIDILTEVDTKNIEPTAQITGLENVIRDDAPSSSLTQQQALANTKKQYKGFFIVDAILENE